MARYLFHNMALNYENCIKGLEGLGKETFPLEKDGPWCNATWDSVLCWPAIPANSSYTMPCPPLKGLDPEKNVTKYCHHSARWLGKSPDDFGKSQGWTNFTTCMTPAVRIMLDSLGADAMQRAQEIARGVRKFEFVGLALSFVSLIAAISILAFFRRLRVFRNQIHLQLMLAILLTVIIRLILYIDQIFTDELGTLQASDVGFTINTTKVVCEAFYFLLEYGKTVAFAWMFIEGFYLHNTIVVSVFQEAPKIWKYLIIGWGLPLIHVTIWLLVTVARKSEIEKCLGSYYLDVEFWIMNSVRLAELVTNGAFLLNIMRVLWYKVKETHSATEATQLNVKAALMLIPLLGIPNIMQTIPYSPTRYNIVSFAIFTYIASFFYMYQGLMVAVVYCFTNREVMMVIKSHYERYRLQHSTAAMLRRGSRGHIIPPYFNGSTSVSHVIIDPTHNHERDGRLPITTPALPLLPPSYETVMAQNGNHPTKIANGHSVNGTSTPQLDDLYGDCPPYLNGFARFALDSRRTILASPSAQPISNWQDANTIDGPSQMETCPLVDEAMNDDKKSALNFEHGTKITAQSADPDQKMVYPKFRIGMNQ